jgi:DNA-binding NarL/FixJ family response regulator
MLYSGELPRVLTIEANDQLANAIRNGLVQRAEVRSATRATAARVLTSAEWPLRPDHVILLDFEFLDVETWCFVESFDRLQPRPGLGVVSEVMNAQLSLNAYRMRALVLTKPFQPGDAESVLTMLGPKVRNNHLHAFSRRFRLSPSEARVLELELSGLERKEVAKHMGKSLSTIKTYWDRIRSKTDERTHRDVLRRYVCFCQHQSNAE